MVDVQGEGERLWPLGVGNEEKWNVALNASLVKMKSSFENRD